MKVTKEDLQGEGSRVIGTGTTTDKIVNYYGWGNPDKCLKFVVVKGFIDDWCIYLEAMDREQDIEKVRSMGNKIYDLKTIKLLVECSNEVFGRYRY